MKKDEFIKIRISKKDKERLIQLSKKENENLSSFILRKSLCQETASSHISSYILPQEIYVRNFVNEIYHTVNKTDNEELKKEITTICNTYLLNQRLGGK